MSEGSSTLSRKVLKMHLVILSVFFPGDDMIVFCSQKNIRVLFNSKYVVCDGTFGYAPKGTYQIYRIFGSVRGHWFPLVTALLKDKKEETYNDLWDCIYNTLSAFDPTAPKWVSIHFDHEASIFKYKGKLDSF